MSARDFVKLLAVRELGDRLRNRGFVLGTIIPAVILAGVIIGFGVFGDDGPGSFELGVVGEVPDGFAAAIEDAAAQPDVEVALEDLADRDAAADAVEDGDVDAALLDGRELMVDGSPPGALQNIVNSALQQLTFAEQLAATDLTEQQLAQVLGSFEPVAIVDTAGEADDGFASFMLAIGATVLLFVAVMTSATYLLTGAVEERSSRVVEVLLGTVRPWHLLTAKIMAMTVLALGQLAVYLAAIFGANALVGLFELPGATTLTVVSAVVMVTVGFVFYAALYTVAGSLATSVEDAQSSAGPLGFLVAGAYFAAFFLVIPAPRGLGSQILTYLPPTAPFVVPARAALDAVSATEVALATLITFVGAALVVRLSGRLYAASLLAGGKLTWREAWRREPVH